MNITKRIIAFAVVASVSALAQTPAPNSVATPDTAPAQPVAEVAEVAAPEIIPADSAVADSTAQNTEPVVIEETREAVAETVADTTAPVTDTTAAINPVDSVKTEQAVAAAAPDTAKPVVDSVLFIITEVWHAPLPRSFWIVRIRHWPSPRTSITVKVGWL